MTDPSFSPAPLVEQALQALRGNAPEPDGAAVQTQATDAPATPSAKTKDPSDQTRVKPDRPRRDQPRSGASTSLDSALEALRVVSATAQTRLANPEDFPELPIERDLPELGPYVEHVMREAQAAAAAYREEAARETTVNAAKLLGDAAAAAEKIRQDADAYAERTLAQADALLAERVQRIAELTGRLSQMARRAGDEFGGDQMLRDQMMQFISSLTATAEDAVAEVFPNTTVSPPASQAVPVRSHARS